MDIFIYSEDFKLNKDRSSGVRWDDDAAATARVAGLVQFPEQTPRDTSAATKVQTPSYSSDTARLRERRKGASLELIWIMYLVGSGGLGFTRLSLPT
jgi:hypothetical protein